MIYYPQELNGQPIYIKSMKVTSNKKIIKSEYDSGYVIQRPKFTRVYKTFELTYDILMDSEVQVLETFFNTYVGMSFYFVNPITSTEHYVMFDTEEFPVTYQPGQVRRDLSLKLREV